jgi:hypothetical protein
LALQDRESAAKSDERQGDAGSTADPGVTPVKPARLKAHRRWHAGGSVNPREINERPVFAGRTSWAGGNRPSRGRRRRGRAQRERYREHRFELTIVEHERCPPEWLVDCGAVLI